MEEEGVLETHPAGPPGFRPGPAAWLGHLPRKAGDLNATANGASLSGRARPPDRFTFRVASGRGQANHPVRADRIGRDPPATGRAPPEIRTRNVVLLRNAALPVGLEGHECERLTGFEPATSCLGSKCSTC